MFNNQSSFDTSTLETEVSEIQSRGMGYTYTARAIGAPAMMLRSFNNLSPLLALFAGMVAGLIAIATLLSIVALFMVATIL